MDIKRLVVIAVVVGSATTAGAVECYKCKSFGAESFCNDPFSLDGVTTQTEVQIATCNYGCMKIVNGVVKADGFSDSWAVLRDCYEPQNVTMAGNKAGCIGPYSTTFSFNSLEFTSEGGNACGCQGDLCNDGQRPQGAASIFACIVFHLVRTWH